MFFGLSLALAVECEPLSSGEFRDYVVDAVNRLERDDLEVTRSIIALLSERMKCLDHAPEPRLLSDLRVVQSVLAFADEGDWQGPLTAALRIRPSVDRIVGRAHPMYAWTPEPAPPAIPIQTMTELYVDGRRAYALPSIPGWYVLQKSNGIDWNTSLIRGAQPSHQWATAPVEVPPALVLEGWISTLAGGAQTFQNTHFPTVEGEPVAISAYDRVIRFQGDPANFANTWDPEGRGVYGVRLEGRAWLYGPVGFLLSGEYNLGLGVSVRDGRAMAVSQLGSVRLGLGVGAADVALYRRSFALADDVLGFSAEERAQINLAPDLVVSKLGGFVAMQLAVTMGSQDQAEVAGDFGFRFPGGIRVNTRMNYTFQARTRTRIAPVVGVYLNASTADFEAAGVQSYTVRTAVLQTGLLFGGRFGGRL